MSDGNTTLGLKESTKKKLEPIKQESDAATWDSFVDGLVEQNLDVKLDELEAQEIETHERVEQTRATVVGVLEAVDEADMTDDIVDIIKSLSEQDMLAQNQEILNHLMEKSQRGEPLNEVDRLLAEVVMETESSREAGQSPAAEIAKGLFAGREHRAAERTTTEREATLETGDASEDETSLPGEDDLGSGLFDGVEDADDDSATVESNVTVSNGRMDSGEEDDE